MAYLPLCHPDCLQETHDNNDGIRGRHVLLWLLETCGRVRRCLGGPRVQGSG